jgi:hypothetical protein
MDSEKIIEDITKRIEETRNITQVIQKETLDLKKEAIESKKDADAAWELVAKVREEMKQGKSWSRV